MKSHRFTKSLIPLAALAAATLVAGCASDSGNAKPATDVSGYDFGAPAEEVTSAIEGLEPVTLKFQPFAISPNSPLAAEANAFKEAVEDRSNGQITVDIIYNFAVASLEEVDDALRDGRLDLASTLPIYNPAEYPIFGAYGHLAQYSEPGLLPGEVITQAAASHAGWNDDALIEEFTSKDLTVLNPLLQLGDFWLACAEPVSSAEDWEGRQVRIASNSHLELTESIGASPVSMSGAEVYEGLQRGAVDCTYTQAFNAGPLGTVEVAPYLSVMSEGRMATTITGAHVAGTSFDALPLPYQQIIFDAAAIDMFHGHVSTIMDSTYDAMEQLDAENGTINNFDAETERKLLQSQEELVANAIEEGLLQPEIKEEFTGYVEQWTQQVEDLGYPAESNFEDLTDWYTPGDLDFRPLAEMVFHEAAQDHRPEAG